MAPNLELLWKKTKFDADSKGDQYVQNLVRKGKLERLDDENDMELPAYYDRDLFKRGQRFFYDYKTSHLMSVTVGFIMVLAVESILNVLECTRMSSTPKTAYKRYVETVLYYIYFYKDLPDDPKSWCARSLEGIRDKHRKGSKVAERKGKGFINQKDMAITQFGFIGFTLLEYKKLGIPFNRDDFYALTHLWRVVGHCIGIKEEFNLCSSNLDTTIDRCKSLLTHVVTPAIYDPPHNFGYMYEALINGLWYVNHDLEVNKFRFLIKRYSKCPGYFMTEDEKMEQRRYIEDYPHYIPNIKEAKIALNTEDNICAKFKELNWSSRMSLTFLEFMFSNLMYNYSIVRFFMRIHAAVSAFMLEYFPLSAIIKFGYKHAYVRILKH